MPKQRVALRMIKDIIRLKWEGQLSHEQIAAVLAVSKGVVTKYVGLVGAAGLNWETVREWDERQLLARLVPRSASAVPYVEPDWGRIHQELSRKGVTLFLTRSDLLEIIDDRAAHRATVITTQLPVDHWHAWIGDATIADAILDRVLQQLHRVELAGESLRRPAASANAKKAPTKDRGATSEN